MQFKLNCKRIIYIKIYVLKFILMVMDSFVFVCLVFKFVMKNDIFNYWFVFFYVRRAIIVFCKITLYYSNYKKNYIFLLYVLYCILFQYIVIYFC